MERVHFFQDLSNLRLKQDDQQNDEDLPQDLKHPCGEKQAPGPSESEGNPQCHETHQRLEGFSALEP